MAYGSEHCLRSRQDFPALTRNPSLAFLDGLRAFACLYVLIFHELSPKLAPGHGEPSRLLAAFLPHLNRGRFGVVFFIVLSGFSLMLPLDATKPLRVLLVSLSADADPYPGETIEPQEYHAQSRQSLVEK